MSDLEALATEQFGALTVAEITLLRNAVVGELAVCGINNNQNFPLNDPIGAENWGTDRSIRGDLIAWLCADRKAKGHVDPKGIHIFGARITGSINLLSVTIEFPMAFACCELRHELILLSARTRALSFTQTYMQSIVADGAFIAGAVFLRDCLAGQLLFSGAHIEGQFACTDSSFATLIFDGGVARVGVLLRHSKGQVKITRARIGTDLDCEAALLQPAYGSSGPAMDAQGVNVEGSVFLRAGFRALGAVGLLGAQIGSNLDCTGGEFTGRLVGAGRIGEALRADLVAVKGTVLLSNGFRARGAVHFTSSQIGGDFNGDRSTFETGLTIERASIEGAFFWHGVTLAETAGLDLINTSVDSLSDDRASWPAEGHLELHGFTYQRIALASPRHIERLQWLARQKSFASQPYRQLCTVLKDEGDDDGALQVLYEMQRLRRANATGLARPWNFALRVAIGYGYYPRRALWWFIGLVVLGFLLFTGGFYAGNMVPTDKDAYLSFTTVDSLPGHYERFHALVFSLENSLSLFKLGQVDHWQPDPSARTIEHQSNWMVARWLQALFPPNFLQWFQWIQVLLGWSLATMWIAGVTGLIRRD